jgi:multiple sugar transport system permease protein
LNLKLKRIPTTADWIAHLLLLCFSAFVILPFMWIISTSFRLPRESFKIPPAIFPTTLNWEGYSDVFARVPYLSFYFNSSKIAFFIVLGVVITSSMAAYAFSRIQFPGRNFLFIMMITGLMIPQQVTIIPLFIMVKQLGWMDSHYSLIIPALINPLAIFLIRQTMLTIPKDYEEAAFMDGAGRVKMFLNVIVPMSMPAISVAAIWTFIHSWNEFFRPLIFLNSFEKMTIPLGLVALQGLYQNGNLPAILAGVTMSLFAPLAFYMFGQKYFLSGIMQGGVKS